jgi:hypothetical protein
MFLIVAILIGVVLGYAFGGRLSHLAALRFRHWWLILLSLAIQLSIFPLIGTRPLLPYATVPLHYLSYALIFAFLVINYRAFPLLVIGFGAVLNLLAIGVNGGYMPSSITALSRAGAKKMVAHLMEADTYGNVIRMSEQTRLNVLGDLLYLPKGFPLATAFSVGDLIIAFGLLWLVVWGMRRRDA